MTQSVPTPPAIPKQEVTKKKNYKPRVRKSAPAAKPLPKVYIEEKKKEIPLYDPFTVKLILTMNN